jgi:DNA-binding MarR family transcriptional regulator
MTGAESKKMVQRTESSAEAGFHALIRVSGLLDRVMQPYFGRFGISRSQWGVLRTLQRAERAGASGLRLMELGDRLLVRPPSVTGLLDRMERLGYVNRNSSAHDLRGKEVRLTDTGRNLIDRVLQNHAAQVAGVMGGLSLQKQKRLIPLLESLNAHLEEMLERANDAGISSASGSDVMRSARK